MSRAGHASEPTMEEILASIRRIISDDDAAAAAAPDARETGTSSDIRPATAPATLRLAEDMDDEIFELTDVAPEETAAADPVSEPSPAPAETATSGETAQEPDTEPAFEPADPGDIEIVDVDDERIQRPSAAGDMSDSEMETLLSDTANQAVSDAFSRLAATLITRSGPSRTLEELVEDMLRPMMKDWLDRNLPDLVEQIVREEIERVTRRRFR